MSLQRITAAEATVQDMQTDRHEIPQKSVGPH